MSIKLVKYLYNYTHDCIKLELQERFNHDEISTFLNAYYAEAVWRLFQFPMHHQSHAIIRLAIHLPDQQNGYFIDGHEEKALFNAAMILT